MEANATVNTTTFRCVTWRHGDPYPNFGETCGIDTETTLIDDIETTPDLAYAGFFVPDDNTCYIADHVDALELIEFCSSLDCVQYYFNAAFDFLVFDKALKKPHNMLWSAVACDYVIDVGCRAQLHEIATLGYTTAHSFSLKGMCKHYLKYDMDKGEDQGDAAARLTFRPGVPITEEQLIYLGIDCFTTWALGATLPKRATEATHTRGSIVLRAIETNGLCVDRRVWDAFVNMLQIDQEQYRQELLSFGFPDPVKTPKQEKQFDARTCALLERIIANAPADMRCPVTKVPSKDQMRRLFVYMYSKPDQLPVATATVMADPRKIPDKKERETLAEIIETYNLGGVFEARSGQALAAVFYTVLSNIWQTECSFASAMEAADLVLQENPQWLAPPVKQIGPKAFMQQHLKELSEKYPKLRLSRTKKSGELKLTKDDLWLLTDMGISDPFLTAHQNYCHATKFLSTYLNDKFIRRDGRIHPRYTNILRTGRTSCRGPLIRSTVGYIIPTKVEG